MTRQSAPSGLPERLLASAADGSGEKAALAVLIAHDRWLNHPGFLLACLREFRSEVWITWKFVGRFLSQTPCSDLDREILLMASELAVSASGRRLDESATLRQVDGPTRERLAEAMGPKLRKAVGRGEPAPAERDLPADLAVRVLRAAAAVPGMTGPARLLVVTPWLEDRAFVEQCIALVEDGERQFAVVDWSAVAGFLDEGPDGDADAVGALRAAVELAGKALHANETERPSCQR